MDYQRKGDVRVYVVSGLFFSCIVAGGVFLGLYMYLPETQALAWFPVAGMVLVSFPWAFWFFTFMYRCVRPYQAHESDGNNPRAPKTGGGAGLQEPTVVVEDSLDCESPVAHSPSAAGGERRVQFGDVVVLGNKVGGDQRGGAAAAISREQQDRESSEISNCSRESEIPLRYTS